MTGDEFSRKLADCFASGLQPLAANTREKLMSQIERLEGLEDVRELLKAF